MALIWFLRAWCGPAQGWWQHEKMRIKRASSPESRSQLSHLWQCPNHWISCCRWVEEVWLPYGCCVVTVSSSASGPAVLSRPFCQRVTCLNIQPKAVLGTWDMLNFKVRYWSPPPETEFCYKPILSTYTPGRKKSNQLQIKRSPKISSSFFITRLTHSRPMPSGHSCPRKTKINLIRSAKLCSKWRGP